MIDTLNTAMGFGLDPDAIELDIEPFKSNGLNKPGTDGETFLHLIQSWTRLTSVLNELSRAISSPDFYPFVLCERVAAKLHFIHWVISQASSESSNNSLSSV